MAAWLVEAHIEFGELNTTTLQQIGPALTGGCFSLFISLILTVLLSYLVPQHYDWKEMQIAIFDDTTKDVSLMPRCLLLFSIILGGWMHFMLAS